MTHFTMKAKHYDRIAEIIKKTFELQFIYDKRYYLITELNEYFKSENIKFDEKKFNKGCGLE